MVTSPESESESEPPIVVLTPTPERLLWHSLPMKLLICCLSGIKFGQFCIYFFSSKNSWPLLRASAKREASFYWCLIYTKNLSMSGRSAVVTLLLRASAKREASFYWHTLKIWVWAAGRSWSRFWDAYISGTVSPIDKRFSLVGSPIPSAVHGTNAESCQCQLWHVARATWGDVTNVPPTVSR